jgi:Xaa-Pro aminopeptidase
MTRIEAVAGKLAERGLENLVVSNIHNVRYLSGFSGSTAMMLIASGKATLVTDFRYKEQAEGEVFEGIEVRIDTREALKAVCEMVSEVKGKTGLEAGTLTYSAYDKLRAAAQEAVPIEPGPLSAGIIGDLRKFKDEKEIESLRKAAQIADEVFSEIVKEIRAGMTEVKIAARIDYMLRLGSREVPSFETIVASGEHASLPHASPTLRVLKEGDLVTMDFGAIWDGYCSDITRTVVVGKASDKVREVYGIVLEAQLAAIDGIKAGAACCDIDALARDLIETRGYGENFGHGLGHGLGLEVHEGPRLSKKSEEILAAGMVTTVEPGIYIPGWGGVRIEDDVVVRDGRCENLTGASKELIEVGV